MNGKVIEGKYAGANVNKVPDKNLLFIQTEDGNKIPLSKSNVISIDDITDQYVSNARKTIMVLWNDFETSVIMLGLYEHTSVDPSTKNPTNNEFSRSQQRDVHQENDIHNEVSDKSRRTKSRSVFVPVIISAGVTTIILLSVFLISLRIGVLQFSSSKSTLSDSHISSNGIVDSSHKTSEGTIDTIDTPNSAQHVVVTKPSTAATPSAENIADLLNIEMVKWHKHYINADDYHCDLIVTNNSKQLVDAQFAIKYLDASGNIIGVSNVSTEALGPGASHLLTSDNETPYEEVIVSVTSAKVDDRYKGSMENVTCDDYAVNGEKVIFEVTNNGNAAVAFVRANVLFYNGENVVDYGYTYAIDADNELKPGATLMAEVSTNKSFTSYRIFYYGRID